MNHRRRQDEHPKYRRGERGPNSRPLCRRCLAECPKGRRTFCSDECVRDFLLAKGSNVRVYVAKRDHGVCAVCGRDCERTDAVILRMAHRYGIEQNRVNRAIAVLAALGDRLAKNRMKHPDSFGGRAGWSWIYSVLLTRCGWSAAQAGDTTRSLWQADHIVPLIEGGGTGMENLRTLCVPCHSRATSALAGRMAR